MNPEQKDINIIHNCEKHFYNWLKIRLHQRGIFIDDKCTLTDILVNYEKELFALKQHIAQLKNWDYIKNECFRLTDKLNGEGDSNEYLQSLIEKTAFEGQVLWLTIKED